MKYKIILLCFLGLVSCFEKQEIIDETIKPGFLNNIHQTNNFEADTVLAYVCAELFNEGYFIDEVVYYTVITTLDSSRHLYTIVKTLDSLLNNEQQHITIKYFDGPSHITVTSNILHNDNSNVYYEGGIHDINNFHDFYV